MTQNNITHCLGNKRQDEIIKMRDAMKKIMLNKEMLDILLHYFKYDSRNKLCRIHNNYFGFADFQNANISMCEHLGRICLADDSTRERFYILSRLLNKNWIKRKTKITPGARNMTMPQKCMEKLWWIRIEELWKIILGKSILFWLVYPLNLIVNDVVKDSFDITEFLNSV